MLISTDVRFVEKSTNTLSLSVYREGTQVTSWGKGLLTGGGVDLLLTTSPTPPTLRTVW